MQVGEFRLKGDNGMAIAGNISRTPGAGARPPRRFDHGIDDRRVTAHPEIVVGAPNDDLAAVAPVVPRRIRRARSISLQIGENAITALAANAVEV